jgi:enamine deaminase RidA (YjgF/YER057c/UK114 family)
MSTAPSSANPLPAASGAEARLSALGLTVPVAPTPAAAYVPFVRSGDLLHIAGQVPVRDGQFRYLGKLGVDFDLAAGQDCAREVALNVLAQVKAALGGDLDRVVRVVKLNGFVNCASDFVQQPQVMNAASELMVAAFGEAGRHARSAVGVASLPFGVAVEIDGVFEVR